MRAQLGSPLRSAFPNPANLGIGDETAEARRVRPAVHPYPFGVIGMGRPISSAGRIHGPREEHLLPVVFATAGCRRVFDLPGTLARNQNATTCEVCSAGQMSDR